MPLLRAQVVHQHRDGQPKNVFVNTFHFDSPSTSVATAEAVAQAVRDFYVLDVDPLATSIADSFGDQVATVGHQVRMYPISLETGNDERGEGFDPIWVEAFDHVGRPAASVGSSVLPSEVSACMSYRNEESSAVPPRRRRGRVYLPPFSVGNIGEEVGTSRPLIPEGARNLIVGAGVRLRDDATIGALGVQWVIFSRPFEGRGEVPRPGRTTLPAIPARVGSTWPVTRIWCDDAWDIQRRRGEKALNRTLSA